MEWRYFMPVVLAVVMFLLVGSLFERRIEAGWRQHLEHRRSLLTGQAVPPRMDVPEAPPAPPPPPPPAAHPQPIPIPRTLTRGSLPTTPVGRPNTSTSENCDCD